MVTAGLIQAHLVDDHHEVVSNTITGGFFIKRGAVLGIGVAVLIGASVIGGFCGVTEITLLTLA